MKSTIVTTAERAFVRGDLWTETSTQKLDAGAVD